MASFYRLRGKRFFDAAASAVLMVALSPVLFAVGLLVRTLHGPPVLFRQQRSGREGRPFTLLKFRTMIVAEDADGKPLPDERRLTPLGRVLRRWSLDELPELWNVFRGAMSLVGPRPLLMRYLDRYTTEQARRHAVRPGITGLAQVDGRNALSWEERFRLDVRYVDSLSFGVDVRILLRTFGTVVTGRGVSAAGCATMEEFLGNEREHSATPVGAGLAGPPPESRLPEMQQR